MQPSLLQIKKLPKSDLHTHIEWGVDFSDLFKIAKKYSRDIKTLTGHILSSPSELSKFIMGDGYDQLYIRASQNFFDNVVYRFSSIYSALQTKDMIREFGKLYVKNLKNDGVIYAEARFIPRYCTFEGLSIEDVVSNLLDGLQEECAKQNIHVNLFLGIGRDDNAKNACKTIDVAKKTMSRGVIGIDLSGIEMNNPPEKFLNVFKKTFETSLKRTIHAGESCLTTSENLKNIKTSIIKLNAHAIGHAINLAESNELIHLMATCKVRHESNPISNKKLGLITNVLDLKLNDLLAKGIHTTINSDATSLWTNGDLSHNYMDVCKNYCYRFNDLEQLIFNSFNYSFTNNESKEILFEQYYKQKKLFF